MAKSEGEFALSDFGISDSIRARLRRMGADALLPIQPGEWTINDFIREANITNTQAEKRIRDGVKAGEIIATERLRYRVGESPVNGNKMAYRFVKDESENAEAKPNQKSGTSKKNRRPR